jgi:sigma-E factor negative regulatory protein RseA
MSEQIREQVSAFLDGELPAAETELLLKRLTRDEDLRESFGRYALIGEACRGHKHARLSRGIAARVNGAIDGEPVPGTAQQSIRRAARWWRPMAGATVAASVAVVAVFALQQRANTPTLASAMAVKPVAPAASAGPGPRFLAKSTEPVSYTTPQALRDAPTGLPAARLTNYVFAHSKYSSLLGQRDVLTGLMVESDEPASVVNEPSP